MTTRAAPAAEAWREQLVANAASDFRTFCALATDGYQPARHTDALCLALQRLEQRRYRRLIIEVPPQHGKSTTASIAFPAWYLGRHPRDRVILASYAQQLATRNGRSVRNLINADTSPFDGRVAYDQKAAAQWETQDGGGLLAVGAGAGVTGFRGNLIVLDDPMKDREEAESELVRENRWQWYTDVLRTRRTPGALEVIIMTRWHEQDIVGRIKASAQAFRWKVLTLPAIAEEDDLLGRKAGEALWPERYPVSELPSVEFGEISERSFAALYQQRPYPAGGSVFRRDWLQTWPGELPPERTSGVDQYGRTLTYRGTWRVIQTVDSSWDKGVGHDFSVIATWATDGIGFYLLDVWRDRVEYPDLERIVAARFAEQTYRPTAVVVEDKANGRVLIQRLRRMKIPVMPFSAKGSKEARADAVTPMFAAHAVWLPPTNPPWLAAWIEEHLAFPNGEYDDQVDTTSSALLVLGQQWTRRPIQVTDDPGELELTEMQRRAAALRRRYGIEALAPQAGPSRIPG